MMDYHRIHGYLYLSSDGKDGIWAYSQERRWFWSTQDLYPYIYQAIKVPGCTCWESPTEKASFSITEPIGSSFNKDQFREVAVK